MTRWSIPQAPRPPHRLTPEIWEDTYGCVIQTFERHPLCTCKVPCQERFTCASSLHRGSRQTPWCSGGDDGNDIERCDECWCARKGRVDA